MADKRFNIFQVAGIWKSEEIHTRIIAELINPQSEFHNMGCALLKRFIGVLELPEALDGPETEVETEVHTGQGGSQSGDRRIDMVISTDQIYLPFEVKIWAGDQERQLYDYYHFALTQRAHVPFICYLTPHGDPPSPWSTQGSTGESLEEGRVCCRSFQKHIRPWLKGCLEDKSLALPSDVAEIMRQLHDNITDGFTVEKDILDVTEQILSRDYHLTRAECTADYRTFTLNPCGALEVALRVKKHYGGNKKVKLSVIFGRRGDTDGAPRISYAGALTREQAEELLNQTFACQTYLKQPDPGMAVWDWLTPCVLSGAVFRDEVQKRIFNCLRPEVQARLRGQAGEH